MAAGNREMRAPLAVIAEPIGIVNIQRSNYKGDVSTCKAGSVQTPLQELRIHPWQLFSEVEVGEKQSKKRKTIWPADPEHANKLILIFAKAWLDMPSSIVEKNPQIHWTQLLNAVSGKDPLINEIPWKLAQTKFNQYTVVVRKELALSHDNFSDPLQCDWYQTWSEVLKRLDRVLDEKRRLREDNQEPCKVLQIALHCQSRRRSDGQQFESREQAVKQREKLVQEQERMMKNREQAVQQREAAIKNREKEVIGREETVNYLQQRCKELEKKISSKEEEVQKKEEGVRKSQQEVQEKLEAALKVEAEVKQREEAVAKKEQEARQKSGGTDYSMREKEQFMYMRERELLMKEQMMYGRELAVSKREHTVHEVDQNLRKKEQELNLKEKYVQDRLDAAKEMEQTVRSREITLYDERTKHMQTFIENKVEKDREERMTEFANFALVVKQMMRDVIKESAERNKVVHELK
ncbi:hypothetical protein GUITHDRAFT_105915 [Guillardia theta CCMP2712]|uniref:Uncharacterized protein n=1 Tax=Guillardia theta (strain CCMP2712) TaxID=905079 RepID=L1JIH1_GUITC|nr:hypothetical protein GUITHDRAFT_105915 [Guillardia theta CCMP2712]EKX48308.1 hypothetical protein GUITHDRAFT_105915 [Guillardia theta CCMP2712]|eukprot:XP_005835288.1 hypothetical protein GUITHDRAFT_105915 [Guillardia theta CCMP2712]